MKKDLELTNNTCFIPFRPVSLQKEKNLAKNEVCNIFRSVGFKGSMFFSYEIKLLLSSIPNKIKKYIFEVYFLQLFCCYWKSQSQNLSN